MYIFSKNDSNEKIKRIDSQAPNNSDVAGVAVLYKTKRVTLINIEYYDVYFLYLSSHMLNTIKVTVNTYWINALNT